MKKEKPIEKQRPQLGDEVRDRVSGAKEIAVAMIVWINGCLRVVVQGSVDKDGKLPDPNTFDEPNLEVMRPGVIETAGRLRVLEIGGTAAAGDPTTGDELPPGGPIATPARTSKVKL